MLKRFGDLFSESITEYGDKFKPIFRCFLYLSLIPAVIFIVLAIVVMITVVGSAAISGNAIADANVFNLASIAEDSVTLPIWLVIPLFLVGLIFLILMILLQICYIYISFFGKKEMSFKKIFASSKVYFWGYVGLTLLIIALLILLFAALIIPGIIFMVYWCFAVFIFMKEKSGAWDSMKRSKALVRRSWWRTFGFILLIGLLTSIVSMILGFIPIIGQLILPLIVTPFTLIFFKNMYLDLKENAGKK